MEPTGSKENNNSNGMANDVPGQFLGAPAQGFGQASAQPGSPVSSPVPTIPSPSFSPASNGGNGYPAMAGSTPSVDPNTTNIQASDESVITDKMWSEKVKIVVNETKGNPFIRSQKIAALKSEYITKTYGKRLGQNEQKS